MTDIIINPKDNTYVTISTSLSIEREIWDYFTIKVPNFQYKKRQNKRWEGHIRLFNLQTKQLYVGILPFLHEFAAEHGYVIKSNLQPTSVIPSKLDILKFIDEMNVSNQQGNSIKLRDYQIYSLIHIIQKPKRCLLLLPTGSGKSLVLYLLIRYILRLNPQYKILLLVPTTNLCEQLYQDFKDYSQLNKWSAEEHCHLIYSGLEKETHKSVRISTWQSASVLPSGVTNQIDAILVDEAHTATAKVLRGLVGDCKNAEWRVGLTGTINDDENSCHPLILQGLFGLIYQPTRTHLLMEKNKLSRLLIKCIVLTHQTQYKPVDYQDEKSYLVGNAIRNGFITNLALDQKKNTLILFEFVEKHGKVLLDLLNNRNKDPNRKIFYISGEVETEVREEIKKITETETNAVILASYGTFQLGVNLKNLHSIIFASPAKSKIRVLQSIGRVLRLHENKEFAVLFDIADDLRDKTLDSHTKMNYTLLHFVARLKIYDQEQFKYQIFNIPL